MKLYIMDIKETEKNSILAERMFASLSGQRQEKMEKCRYDKDKMRSLCAGALLSLGVMEWEEKEQDFSLQKIEPKKVNWEMLSAFYETQKKDISCGYGKSGKPYFLHYPSIHFNLSHSGDYVVAAFDRQPVGIDIQEHRALKESMERHFLQEEELESLSLYREEGKREELLCRLWAIKESYVKLTGEGMKKPMKEFRVNRQLQRIENENGEPVAGFTEKIWQKKYYISICSF